MNKIISLLLVLFMLFLPFGYSHSKEIPKQKKDQVQVVLQEKLNVFVECVMEEASSYISFGFSTPTSVAGGFSACGDEMKDLSRYSFDEIGSSPEQNTKFMGDIYVMCIEYIDNQKDTQAQERLEKFKKKNNLDI